MRKLFVGIFLLLLLVGCAQDDNLPITSDPSSSLLKMVVSPTELLYISHHFFFNQSHLPKKDSCSPTTANSLETIERIDP